MSYPFEDPQLTASRATPPPQAEGQYGTVMLGQSTFGSVGSEFVIPTTGAIPPTTGILPVSAGSGPPPTAPRPLMPPTAGRPLSPPATSLPVQSMPLPMQATASPTGSRNFGVSAPPMTTGGFMPSLGSLGHPSMGQFMNTPPAGGGSLQQVEGPQIGLGARSRSQRSLSPQTAPRGDGGGRLLTQPVERRQDLFSSSAGLQPRTGPLQGSQQLGVRSLPVDRVTQMNSESQPRMEASSMPPAASSPPAMFTTAAVPQLQAQDSMVSLQTATAATDEENELLQQRVAQLTQQLSEHRSTSVAHPGSSADVKALQQRLREAEDSEANALRAHEARLHEINALERQIYQIRGGQGGDQRMVGLQQSLEAARQSEASQRRMVEEQAARLEAQHMELQRVRNSQGMSQQSGAGREQDLERKVGELKRIEDTYQKQLQQDRKTIADLQAQLERESQSKEFHFGQSQSNGERVKNLEEEIGYLRKVEVHHKTNSELHFKEAARLKRLREEDAPPPLVPRMPLKALEERVMHIACFTMLGICALPIMGALAALDDPNYVFWLGKGWPWMVIGGCTAVFFLFTVTLQCLYQNAIPEHRSQFTMAFTWATFAALLGIILVPMSLMANKHALTISSTVSQGCRSALPQSEVLADYSQVLYNIRLSDNCTNAKSVAECKGYAANKYTAYLQYLESDFHCGPLCPESPPPARAIVAPLLYNTIPTKKPTIAPPPMFGPPLQNALSHGEFLQAIREHAMPPSSGVMETALPHVQARKLFSPGETRMTCYPLIATRLQVLVSTFGGLWYWEGMGLIIMSLLTSLYAGMYFALGVA